MRNTGGLDALRQLGKPAGVLTRPRSASSWANVRGTCRLRVQSYVEGRSQEVELTDEVVTDLARHVVMFQLGEAQRSAKRAKRRKK